jgi:hypothetical protein
MSWNDARLLVVPGSVSSQLEDLGLGVKRFASLRQGIPRQQLGRLALQLLPVGHSFPCARDDGCGRQGTANLLETNERSLSFPFAPSWISLRLLQTFLFLLILLDECLCDLPAIVEFTDTFVALKN